MKNITNLSSAELAKRVVKVDKPRFSWKHGDHNNAKSKIYFFISTLQPFALSDNTFKDILICFRMTLN